MSSSAFHPHDADGKRSRLETALIALELFVGAMAFVCGPLLIITDGLGMDRSELEGTPFDNFVIPGLILSLVVGISLIGAARELYRRAAAAPLISLGAGCVLLGWIAVEIVMIDAGRGLQAVILASAVAVLAASIHLLRSRSEGSGAV